MTSGFLSWVIQLIENCTIVYVRCMFRLIHSNPFELQNNCFRAPSAHEFGLPTSRFEMYSSTFIYLFWTSQLPSGVKKSHEGLGILMALIVLVIYSALLVLSHTEIGGFNTFYILASYFSWLKLEVRSELT